MTAPVRNLDSLGRRRPRTRPATTVDDLAEIERAQSAEHLQARECAAEEFTHGNVVRVHAHGRTVICESLGEWDAAMGWGR